MKRFFSRLRDFVKVNRRDLTVFFLSLLLAFSIWLIHNISLRYSEVLTATVSVKSSLTGRRNVSANNCIVIARCRATGYSILRNKLLGGGKPVTVELEPGVLKRKEGDMFYIVPETMPEIGKTIFGANVTTEYYITDTLFFSFPSEFCKRVPVIPMGEVECKAQYMSVKGIELKTDSIDIYGDPARLANVSKVLTRTVYLNELDSDALGQVELEPITGVRLSQSEVEYTVSVRRYVTQTVPMEIEVRGVPARRSLSVYPPTLDVMLNCQFPLAVRPDSVSVLYVDYAEFENSRSGKCLVHLDPLPDGVLSAQLQTEVVTCIAK